MENGTYAARPTGQVHVGDHNNGCLICNMVFAFADGGATIAHTFWMTKKDGSINTRTIDTLKELFGWDGADPFWLEEHGAELAEVDVELVVENETFIGKGDGQEHTSLKIKWVNSPGGGGGNKIENSDRKALMAKYGAKLRAVSGGTTPAKKSAPAKTPAASAPAPKAPPAAKKSVATTPSDVIVCWKAISDAMKDKPKEDLETQWFAILKDVCGEKDQSEYTPQEWGKVLNAIKTQFDNLPFN